MIIHGNYTGGIFPKPDWNQQDASKADFIKGKEIVEQKISSAHNEAKAAGEAAENAQAAAENAEKNAKEYADNLHKLLTVTVPASGWSASAPYTQTVSVEGIRAEDAPHVSPVYSDTLETALVQKEAWEMVSRAKSTDNAITFYCFEDKPTTNIPVQIEVNR